MANPLQLGKMPAKMALMPTLSRHRPARPSYYRDTPAGFPLDPSGNTVWDPKLGSGPICKEMIPKDQPLSHSTRILMRFWSALPTTHELYMPPKVLGTYTGFIRSGALQSRASPGKGAKTKQQKKERESPAFNGSTLYDTNGELICIDGMVLRGNLDQDQNRLASPTTLENFQEQEGFLLWWNFIIYGVYTTNGQEAAVYAYAWLETFAPKKKHDTHGLRFRRLSCEITYNKRMSKMYSKIKSPTPPSCLGQYNETSDSKDENGKATQEKEACPERQSSEHEAGTEAGSETAVYVDGW